MHTSKGFTLIELIMVLVIIGILSAMTTDMIILPVKNYLALERRTTLLDTAEMSLRRMQRDIRRALPNSIRLFDLDSNGIPETLELLHTTQGGRYRKELASDGSGNILDFTTTDNSFDILGTLNNQPSGQLVIYNLGTTLADAYTGNNRVAILNTSTTQLVQFTPAKQFTFQSPQQRFFVVDTPITYYCHDGELRRYDNTLDSSYAISTSAPAVSSLSYALQAKASSLSCQFSYDAGTASRAGLVSLNLTLTDSANESIQLIHQVHVDNLP